MRMGPPGPSFTDELRGGVGDTAKLEEEPVSVVTDGDIDADVSEYRGEPVDGDEERTSMVVPNTAVPVSEYTTQPIEVVSVNKLGLRDEKRLTRGERRRWWRWGWGVDGET